jgi:acyl dehydratase
MEPLRMSAAMVGAALGSLTREVTWRDTMNYAAAVSDDNPWYFADDAATGLLAPPLFAVAVTWPLASDLAARLDGRLDPAVLPRLVHAGEHLIFRQPIRPGQSLTVSGHVDALTATSRGALLTLRFEAIDRAGRPVFTERLHTLFRGVECETAGSVEPPPSVAPVAGGGSPSWEQPLPISRGAAHVYDGCTNIVFPIHTSAAFAKAVGLPDIILQGTALLAMAARELVDREAGRDPRRLAEIACGFRGMVVPGQTVVVRMLGREPDGDDVLLAFEVRHPDGRAAISDGFVRLRGAQ